MKVAALVALVAVCYAGESLVPLTIDPPTIEIAPVGMENETRYLKHAHRASLNFACPVSAITVTQENSDDPNMVDPIVQTELEDHLGEVGSVQWTHTLQTFFSGTDARGQERQLGGLGGDLGQFLIVLAAIESEANKEFTPEEVKASLSTYLTVMSKEKFFFSIDQTAIEVFKTVCGCPNLNIADPPDAKKDLLLNATLLPESMADEFFFNLIKDPAAMGVRGELVQNVLSAFLNTMWDKADPLHRRIKFVLLKGEKEPKAFILVKTPGYCNAQLLAPMISPELCGKQMGIFHGDASVLLRTEMAGILLMKTPEAKNNVVQKSNQLVAEMIKVVMSTHIEPVYTVTFEGADV